jgi:hypothetical protein
VTESDDDFPYDFTVPVEAEVEDEPESVEELEEQLAHAVGLARDRGVDRDLVLAELARVCAPDEPGYELDLIICTMRIKMLAGA